LTLWLKARRARASALSVAAVAAAVILAGDLLIPVPGLLSGTGLEIPLPGVAPMAVAIVVALALSSSDPALERTAVRPLRALDAAYAAAVAGLALAACLACALLVDATLGAAAGRNAIGYVGLMLLGGRMFGSHAAALVPASLILFMALFGGDASGRPRWWAWPLRDAGEPMTWAVAAALLAAGLLAWTIEARSNELR
jgi:hypothetical protein